MLRIIQGNRIETLLDHLGDWLARPHPQGPLANECILVQHQGMARWIVQGLAERQGIAARLRFPFPASFVWEVFRHTLGPAAIPENSPYARETLAWRLLDQLMALPDTPLYAPLQRYLGRPATAERAWRLALRLADLFDQYLVYRPALIRDWETGAEPRDWQAELWRQLRTGIDGPHRADLLTGFQQRAASGALDCSTLPPRLAVFGLSALAPAHLQVLAQLAGQLEIALFAVNPSSEYWMLLDAPRSQARQRERQRTQATPTSADDHREAGHPLLASLGRGARDYLDLLLEQPAELVDAWQPVSCDQLLHCLQADILELRERGLDPDCPPWPLAGDDHSLTLHDCHSPLREIEVLHDALLQRFASLPDLHPREIVVMAPDIGRYAPYIEAVFGSARASRRIPWSIADRDPAESDPLLRAFLALLDLPNGRYSAASLLALLETPAIARRFEIDATALPRLTQWIEEAGIRWGLDAGHRASLDLPAFATHSWRQGLDRLLLGYALPETAAALQGIDPYPEIEGGEADWLGGLAEFINRLQRWHQEAAVARPLTDWVRRLNPLIDALLRPEAEELQTLTQLRETLDELAHQAERAGSRQPLPLAIVREQLRAGLAARDPGRAFLAGGVTFCNLVPMRSVPFRVVCLLGMNDGDYPRQRPGLGFDRIAAQPRKGDRSLRDDDRYLFLEALLSARDAVHISYQGRSPRDNSEQPPSVLVSELLDHLDQSCTAGSELPRRRLLTRHPLQPFSARYFDPAQPALFSYSTDWASAGEPAPAAGEFCPDPLPLAPEVGALELEDLIQFFENPSRAFLRNTLGLHLRPLAEELPEDEDFTLDALAAHRLRERLLASALGSQDLDPELDRLQRQGQLPPGPAGRIIAEPLLDEVQALVADIHEALGTRSPTTQSFELQLADYCLSGHLDGLCPAGRISWRTARLKARDALRLWLNHLVLNALAPPGITPRSQHLARDGRLHLGPVSDARERLHDLITLYQQGQAQPLPFAPASAQAYARARDHDRGLRAARDAWEPPPHNGSHTGEGSDAAHRRCWPAGPDRFGSRFTELAERIWRPLLAATETT